MRAILPLVAALLVCSVPVRAEEDDSFDASAARTPASDPARVVYRLVMHPVTGADNVPKAGHSLPLPVIDYNIWSRNCHTEANYFTALATARGLQAGIVACQGDPRNSPEFHTAAWAIPAAGLTCIYNYGTDCCWEGAASPPDLSAGPALRCAKAACSVQYKAGETRALPAGDLVESPGPAVCAIVAAGGPMTMLPGAAADALAEHLRTRATKVRSRPIPSEPQGVALDFAPDGRGPCLSCCESRAKMWGGFDPFKDKERAAARDELFLTQCRQNCDGAFSGAP